MKEMNKDEADRCKEMAIKAMKEGNKEKAERLLHKAERLYPSEAVKSKSIFG